jgi:hypothetical protein
MTTPKVRRRLVRQSHRVAKSWGRAPEPRPEPKVAESCEASAPHADSDDVPARAVLAWRSVAAAACAVLLLAGIMLALLIYAGGGSGEGRP